MKIRYKSFKNYTKNKIIDISRIKLFKNQSFGFTLIELLLYMGLFSILMTVTFQMFASIFDAQIETEATSSVSSDGKFIMSRFTYDLNNASSITIPTFYGTSSAALTIVENTQNISYSLVSNNLILQNSSMGTSDQLNSNDTSVSDLSFIRLDGSGKDVIQISYTLTSTATTSSGREIKIFNTSAGLR